MAVSVLVALAVSCWFAAAIPPFGVESSAVTFSAAAVVLLAAGLMARMSNTGSAGTGAPAGLGHAIDAGGVVDASLRVWGALAWSTAALFALGVELWELLHSTRSLYPTLSSIANEVLGPGHRVGRAVAFVCWGACGLVLASRPGRRA